MAVVQTRPARTRTMALASLPLALLVAAVVGLVGCGSTPKTPPMTPGTETKSTGRAAAPAPATPASPGRIGAATASAPSPPAPSPSVPPPPPGPLAAEQRWLASLFEGTPVQVIGQANGHAVLVELPLRFAFDAGSNQPKAPLQAVLQRLGLSLKRHPTARLALAAPAPGAAERQHAMRTELAAMGLPLHRLSAAASAASDHHISLRLALAPTAIQRLRDHELPAVPGLVTPQAAAKP